MPPTRHHAARAVPLGKIPSQFAPAVAIGRHDTVWLLTGGGPPATGAATLYRWQPGDTAAQPVADIGAYQQSDPDPYNVEGSPTDSNPFGLAALGDGSVLVADAGGNVLLRVWPGNPAIIKTVARLMSRTVAVPEGMPTSIRGENGQPIPVPPAGTRVPAEAVATSVTVGRDGHWYVGELRGFPATPGTSEIWRIDPGYDERDLRPGPPARGRVPPLRGRADLGRRSRVWWRLDLRRRGVEGQLAAHGDAAAQSGGRSADPDLRPRQEAARAGTGKPGHSGRGGCHRRTGLRGRAGVRARVGAQHRRGPALMRRCPLSGFHSPPELTRTSHCPVTKPREEWRRRQDGDRHRL